ncbi:hypothetical protein BJF79_28085 [Actinomadura sp. CNU-125]|uniref:DUF6807 domain-containing protein n=1 Tax=Actinomadura sp. CNU-125 TaxID=1904961 RepID=UPI000965BE51|nr:PmoA family protein [Actinomadura sp. CNU-125]OLT38018.1 hypothetical protein BJF79_28085 [Actinomadura sp. CNU-125]
MTETLRCAGRDVARYTIDPDLARDRAPRPYLHPVRTLGGTPVTEVQPADHVHHLGVSVAIAHVATPGRKHNFWGGSTYVRDAGPRMLDNHGHQRHLGWIGRRPGELGHRLAWIGSDGTEPLHEERTVRAVPWNGHWALDLTSVLTNVTDADVTLGSSATNGRAGAGYGGFFWRAPAACTGLAAFTADASGESAVHGSRAPWVALAGTAPDGRDWTLVFRSADGDPWFVRAAEYPGVGQALAWADPVLLPPGSRLTRRVVTLVADGRLTAADARAFAVRTRAPAEMDTGTDRVTTGR